MNEWPPSTRPFRSNPPEGTVGIAMPIRDNLRFFKLSYHSILGFTDYRFMLTIIDNMSGFQTRQYLESIQHNHSIHVLQYQKDHDLEEEWNVALKFMFAFSTVKYGLVLTPTVVVEPYWLSKLVRALERNPTIDSIVPECNTWNNQFILFRREAYERVKGDFDALTWLRAGDVYVHKFKSNGFDPRLIKAEEEVANAVRT